MLVNNSKSENRNPRRLRDLLILLSIAVVAIIATTMVLSRVVHQTEVQVETVRKIHMSGAPGSRSEERELESDLIVKRQVDKDPHATKILFDYYEMTDNALAYLRPMRNLKVLSLAYTRISDSGLTYLTDLPIEELNLMETKITDDGLKELAKLKSLQFLELSFTNITDKGLTYLKPLGDLSDLHLAGTKITDAGMSIIADNHPHIWKLMLHESFITDRSMKDLSRLRQMTTLDLGATDVTGAGLASFEGHPAIAKISLDHTNIDDQDVEQLVTHLPNLVLLDLSATRITGKGLMQLSKMKKLETLFLVHCRLVPSDTINLFKRANPGCRVTSDWAPVVDNALKRITSPR